MATEIRKEDNKEKLMTRESLCPACPKRFWICTHTHTHAYTYTYIYMYTCIHTCVYIYVHVYVHTYMYVGTKKCILITLL